MDLRICRYFLTIVEEGSMNKAAKVLHITQPTLSRQIAQLEEELGVQLFERQSKSLHLTGQGLLFARRAREMLELETKTRCELGTVGCELEGELLIGTGEFETNSRLIEAMAAFRRQHPKVRFSLITGTADQAREMLENGLIDIGLFLSPASTKDLHSRQWKQKEIWSAVLRKDHPLAQKESISPQDLQDETLLLPYRKEPAQLLEGWIGQPLDTMKSCGHNSLSANGALRVVHENAVMLTIGGSPSYLHEMLAIRPLDPPLLSTVSLVWKERFPKPPLQEAFLKFLSNECAEAFDDEIQ